MHDTTQAPPEIGALASLNGRPMATTATTSNSGST